jgi:uncharacterized protein YcfJ
MKNWLLIPALACLAATLFIHQTNARPGGCAKGAIVGGLVGHFAGHTGMGAAAGCAYGLHKRHQYDRQDEGRSSSEQRDRNGQRGY